MFDKYGESAAPCGIDPERVILETHDLTRQYEQSDEVITAVILIVLLVFLNVEKHLDAIHNDLKARHHAE